MKRVLVLIVAAALPTAAIAADNLVPKAPIGTPYGWSGFYFGVHGGAGWGRSEGSNTFFSADIDQRMNGWFGGGQIGVNHQIGRAIIGIELSGSTANIEGRSSCLSLLFIPGHTVACEMKEQRIAHLLARVGYAPGDGRFFPYILGGASVARLESAISITPPPGLPPPGSTFFTVAWGKANEHVGATIGAGMQYAVGAGFSIGVDYLITIFDSKDHGSMATATNQGGLGSFVFQNRFESPQSLKNHAVRFVLNYKLD